MLCIPLFKGCLLYTSDAADDMQCVDLGGRRIIKKEQVVCVGVSCASTSRYTATHPAQTATFFQAEDGIRDVERSRGLGDVYKRQRPAGARQQGAKLGLPAAGRRGACWLGCRSPCVRRA